MVRQLTIEFPNAFYHLYNRGVNKQNIFIDEYDFKKFIEICIEAKSKFSFIIHSYCLMNNHYHLFAQTPLGNISKIMKFIDERYAFYFIKKYPNKDGHVFRGRYKRKLVQSEVYATILSRYIHLNPVKAGLTEDPIDWKWSSYRSYIDPLKIDALVDTSLILDSFNYKINSLIKFTKENLNNNIWDPEKESIGGIILGNKEFICEIYHSHIKAKTKGYKSRVAGLSKISRIVLQA